MKIAAINPIAAARRCAIAQTSVIIFKISVVAGLKALGAFF
jgi:hypothetical protein